jgi:hypothetical protein
MVLRAFSARVYDQFPTRFKTYIIATSPHPQQKPSRVGGLGQMNIYRKVPSQVIILDNDI